MMRQNSKSFGLYAFLSIAVLASGCEPAPVAPAYGAPYEIILNDSPGGPDVPPRLHGDRLLTTLSYIGGCADHQFELGYAVRPDTAHIWIAHKDGDDTCDAELTDELHLPLPLPVRGANVIALHVPDGTAPYILRWGR
ncbi:MAG: hypothetical protein R2834_08800 [Rhodothermales bacterium]